MMRTLITCKRNIIYKRPTKPKRTKSNERSCSQYVSIDVIDRQIMELQETYLDDVKMMPETCSMIGLWNYMTKSNYFDGFERKDVN